MGHCERLAQSWFRRFVSCLDEKAEAKLTFEVEDSFFTTDATEGLCCSSLLDAAKNSLNKIAGHTLLH